MLKPIITVHHWFVLDKNFLIANAVHCRIIYCNDGFCDLTGFSRAEVMQKSCRVEFLYGQNTFPQAVQQLNSAIENQTDANIELLLYKKDGKGCSNVLRL